MRSGDRARGEMTAVRGLLPAITGKFVAIVDVIYSHQIENLNGVEKSLSVTVIRTRNAICFHYVS